MAPAADQANVAARLLANGIGDAPAVLDGDAVIPYDLLRQRVRNLAAFLLSAGSAPGERVGLYADNSLFFVEAYLATIWAGSCSVPFPAGVDDSQFGQIVDDTGMSKIFVQQKFEKRITERAGKRKLLLLTEKHSDAAESGTACAAAAVESEKDLACIVYTSGSTGRPKGVMVSHRNIECNTSDIVEYIGLSSQDRVMAVLPLSYCFGASLLHSHLMTGASVVLEKSFMFPEKVLDSMEANACTGLAGVPSTYQFLLRKTTFASRAFPELKWMQQAGGRLPNAFIRELREAQPDVTLFVMYGQTEATARLSYLPPDMLDAKLGSIGKGLPSTRLEVLRDDGNPVECGSDEVGEIVASGDNIALGYWKDPQETKKYFRDGKLFTGDLARVDKDGYIFIADRARDFIKAAGNRVSAKEIEDVLCEHPEVVEAAVIGVPDEVWGEAIVAVITVGNGDKTSAESIRAFCNARLPNFKVPSSVRLVASLPKNSYGKVVKPELRRMFSHSANGA